MIDFYGGNGTYASWPPRVRAYAVQTTPVNILDWASAYSFSLSTASLAAVDIPTLVVRGGASHPAVQRANACHDRHGRAFHDCDTPRRGGLLIGQHVHRAEPVFNAAVAVREIAAIGTSHLTT